MTSKQTADVAAEAKQLYETKLRVMLERSHQDKFIAIEPLSGEYFLAKTFSEAIQASRRAHPDRLAFAMRIGHATAVNIGGIRP